MRVLVTLNARSRPLLVSETAGRFGIANAALVVSLVAIRALGGRT